jgi:hypothetical protein
MPEVSDADLPRIITVDFTGIERPPIGKLRDLESEYHMEFPSEALYGLAGRIVEKLTPHTESHPASTLLAVMTRFGNIIGRTAFYCVEDTRHYANLFVVSVGDSSKARKGTGDDRIACVFDGIDKEWQWNRQLNGFGSGEGVIAAIADSKTYIKKGKEFATKGVADKRLFIREPEFSGILNVMRREGNLLSKILRLGWDGKTLHNKVKHEIDSQTASNPHISVIADITRAELELRMEDVDQYNGFANRFLWMFVQRTKLLPFGGEKLTWAEERKEIRLAIDFARKQKRVFMDEAARKLWWRNYEELGEVADGKVGGITSRAEPQVIRLALIYALLDRSEYIRASHLRAALWLWRYSVRSVKHIFARHGLITPAQQKILDEVANGPTSESQIRELVFKRNRPAALIAADLTALEKKELVAQLQDEKGARLWRLI